MISRIRKEDPPATLSALIEQTLDIDDSETEIELDELDHMILDALLNDE